MKNKITQQAYKPKNYETIRDFCRRMQISVRKFHHLRAQGIIPVIQTGPRLVRIDPELADQALAAYLSAGKQAYGKRSKLKGG